MSRSLRILPPIAFFLAVSIAGPAAQTTNAYREFALGAGVQAVAALAKGGVAPLQTRVARPALIQTMIWRRPYLSNETQPALSDPVKQVEFSFYNDQLYRIVVDYETERTRGLTAADFVESVSSIYGPTRLVSTPASTADDEGVTGRLLGQWGDEHIAVAAYHDADFYTGPGGSRFKLVVTSPALSALSRTAALQSRRQDEREAPQKEIARAQKQADDDRAAAEKARAENKATFKP